MGGLALSHLAAPPNVFLVVFVVFFVFIFFLMGGLALSHLAAPPNVTAIFPNLTLDGASNKGHICTTDPFSSDCIF